MPFCARRENNKSPTSVVCSAFGIRRRYSRLAIATIVRSKFVAARTEGGRAFGHCGRQHSDVTCGFQRTAVGTHATQRPAAAAARRVPGAPATRTNFRGRVARSRDPEMTGNDLPVDVADDADRLYGPTGRR